MYTMYINDADNAFCSIRCCGFTTSAVTQRHKGQPLKAAEPSQRNAVCVLNADSSHRTVRLLLWRYYHLYVAGFLSLVECTVPVLIYISGIKVKTYPFLTMQVNVYTV